MSGVDPELAQHLAECEHCRATWDGQREAIELARQLPAPLPSSPQIEEVRTAILARVSRPAPARSRHLRTVAFALVPAAAVVAIASGVLSFTSTERDEPAIASTTRPAPVPTLPHGTIHATPNAVYQVSEPPDERVRLIEGKLDIAVRPLGPGERYRVIAGDGEVEVRGTAFHVVVHADHLILVEVRHGRVVVRPRGEPTHVLRAGDAWHAPARVTPPIRHSAPPPRDTATTSDGDDRVAAVAREVARDRATSGDERVAVARERTAPIARERTATVAREVTRDRATSGDKRVAVARDRATSGDKRVAVAGERTAPVARERGAPVARDRATNAARSDERARVETVQREASRPAAMYAAGWTALRRRDFTAAAAAFAGVIALAPTSSLAPDAAYWRAVALARGHRRHEAIAAFRDLLDERGASGHAGSASAMLGWLLVDDRAFDEAARRFRSALADPDPAVRRSAASGLAALAER